MKRSPPILKKVSFSLISVLLTLIALEAAMRIVAYSEDQKLLQAALKEVQEIPSSGVASMRHLIRVHESPRIIYDLRPAVSAIFQGEPISINEYGFRGRAYPRKKPDGTVRILGLGDSIMFGWGVKDDEPFLPLLEEQLNRHYGDRNFQVINTAVPGYNTVMQVATLKEKGVQFEPDLVLVNYVGNDLTLPNFIRNEEDYWTLSKSFLYEFVSRRLSGKSPSKDEFLVRAPRSAEREGFEGDPERVPPKYRGMVGLPAYARAMDELRELGRVHGFKVLVCFVPQPTEDISSVCAELGFPMVSGHPAVARYMREHAIEGYRGSELALSASDPHPSPITHSLFADVLFEYLETHEELMFQ